MLAGLPLRWPATLQLLLCCALAADGTLPGCQVLPCSAVPSCSALRVVHLRCYPCACQMDWVAGVRLPLTQHNWTCPVNAQTGCIWWSTLPQLRERAQPGGLSKPVMVALVESGSSVCFGVSCRCLCRWLRANRPAKCLPLLHAGPH